jgi:type 1 glutamine amidotransferase
VNLTRRAAVLAALLAVIPATAADPVPSGAPKRLLLVTHSGGFIHNSVGVAEETLKEIGPKYGFVVTCYRFTGDPDQKVKNAAKKDGPVVETTALEKYSAEFRAKTGLTVGPENCGRINKDTLKNFDAILFFTTGSVKEGQISPLTDAELTDLLEWVKAGGTFTGTHCATDTLFNATQYGDLVGGYFKGHPQGLQKVKLKVEDPSHPAAKPFSDGEVFEDEIYIFHDKPYSRDKLHVILSVGPDSNFPPNARPGQGRTDNDYAISWCQDYGKGKVFYTSLGHDKAMWKNPKFQEHLLDGIKWANGQLPGDATPTAKLKAK